VCDTKKNERKFPRLKKGGKQVEKKGRFAGGGKFEGGDSVKEPGGAVT